MSLAVFNKTLRDYALLIGVVAAAILSFQPLIVRFILVEASQNIEMLRNWLELPLIRAIVSMMLGGDLAGDLTPTTLATIGLAHPFVWAASWALLLAIGSGVVAGEIGRGTADLLLALPISRARVYASTSAVCFLAALPGSAAPPVGIWLSVMVFRIDEPIDYAALWLVAVNLCMLNLCIVAVTLCVSSYVSRRGVAVAIMIAALLASDVINFISYFVESARWIDFLGFLRYYRPLPIVRTGQLPLADLAVLLIVGAIAWTVGCYRFSRRDIPAA